MVWEFVKAIVMAGKIVAKAAAFPYNRAGGILSWEGTMSMSAHLLKRAVELWKSGQRIQARKIFETIVYNAR
jgi:hypothetical protein